MQERFHFGVERSTADDHLAELATESLHELFADARADHLVKERHFQYPAYGRFLDLRNDHLLVYLLQDQRHRQDNGRFDFREGLEQDLRTRCTPDEPCVSACCQTGKEVKRTTVGMSQRQEGYEPRSRASETALQTITDVTRQGIERSDHTLTETGRAARIVDRSDLLVATLVVMNVFCPIAIGVLFLKERIDGIIVDLLGVQFEGDRMPIVQADGSQHMRNLIELNTLPVDVADEEQFGLRVIDNMDRIVRTEILQDRNDDRSIGHRSEIDCYPIVVILTHHGDLVTFLDAAFLK